MFFHGEVASHGGYVYYVQLDLKQRDGERAWRHASEIWVQPPGTPTVGIGLLESLSGHGVIRTFWTPRQKRPKYLFTGNSHRWMEQNCVELDAPGGKRVALYRNGQGSGRNTPRSMTAQTQSAIRLLVALGRRPGFRAPIDSRICPNGPGCVVGAQFPNGAFRRFRKGQLADG